jgi:hypothetical protein
MATSYELVSPRASVLIVLTSASGTAFVGAKEMIVSSPAVLPRVRSRRNAGNLS